jgi:hypothetical protein
MRQNRNHLDKHTAQELHHLLKRYIRITVISFLSSQHGKKKIDSVLVSKSSSKPSSTEKVKEESKPSSTEKVKEENCSSNITHRTSH